MQGKETLPGCHLSSQAPGNLWRLLGTRLNVKEKASPAQHCQLLFSARGRADRAPSPVPRGEAGELPDERYRGTSAKRLQLAPAFLLFITTTPLGKNILTRKLFPFFLLPILREEINGIKMQITSFLCTEKNLALPYLPIDCCFKLFTGNQYHAYNTSKTKRR